MTSKATAKWNEHVTAFSDAQGRRTVDIVARAYAERPDLWFKALATQGLTRGALIVAEHRLRSECVRQGLAIAAPMLVIGKTTRQRSQAKSKPKPSPKPGEE